MRKPIVVSFTTISSRLANIPITVDCLLKQTLRPDRIVINVSLDPFMSDKGVRFEDLPARARRWAVDGVVELYFCKNTGPYRKIMPTIERLQGEDFLVATVDDDVVYPKEWLDLLVKAATLHGCTAAYRCRVMKFNQAGLEPYNLWPLAAPPGERTPSGVRLDGPSLLLCPTGRDGVIYHSKHLADLEALRAFQQLAPAQDDIALKFATLLQRAPVVRAKRELTSDSASLQFRGMRREEGLWTSINNVGRNDLAVSKILHWCEKNRSYSLMQQLRWYLDGVRGG